MRVTTNMVYSQSLLGMKTNNSKMFTAMNQATSGLRVVNPSDDPLAATLALGVNQNKTINMEFMGNQSAVDASLRNVETQLNDIVGVLHRLRDRLIEAGDGAYQDIDVQTLSYDMRQMMDEMLGLSNSKDDQGSYLFSGYQAALQPFVKSRDAAGNTIINYYGDQGERLLQVGPNRYMPMTYSGDDLFISIPTGNTYFQALDDPTNRGSGVISPVGITDPTKWNNPANSKDYSIVFGVDWTTLQPDGPVYKYDIIDNVSGNSMLTGLPPTGTPDDPDNPTAYWRTFEPGDEIVFHDLPGETAGPWDYGFAVKIDGQPDAYTLDGGITYISDTFTITEANPQSTFDTLLNLLGSLDSPRNTLSDPTPWNPNPTLNGNTPYVNAITQALQNIDHALDRALKVQTEIGTHLREVEALSSNGADVNLIYTENISNYVSADYADSMTDFSKFKLALQISQQTFAQISNLSVFNFI